MSIVWTAVRVGIAAVTIVVVAELSKRYPRYGALLLSLPIVSILFYLVGWLAGLLIFRREDHRPMAYIVWSSGVVSSLLFLLAVMFIVTTSA